MKKILIVFCLTLLLSGCAKQKEPLIIEPSIENFVKYIAYEYEYSNAGEFIDCYLENKYSTNLYLINLLKDSYKDIEIVSCDEAGALLRCDDELVRMDMAIEGGKITKIRIKEGRDE